MVYMSKVSDAASADGSSGWFKVFQNGWAKKSGGAVGDDDFWGNKDLNNCCGRMDVKIPSDIAPGDYLLRAETIALHSAGGAGGAQFYLTCYQLTVTGGGSASPPTVSFPGAYKASDPGIQVNIHGALSSYTVPGPAVYSGGENRTPGGACKGCEATCKVGSGPTPTVIVPPPTTSTSVPGGGGNDGGNSGCTAQRYQQCGGTGYTGCTNCAVS
jgi:cellulase